MTRDEYVRLPDLKEMVDSDRAMRIKVESLKAQGKWDYYNNCPLVPDKLLVAAAELADRYHRETEAYDRTVCTGPILEGSVMPIGSHEIALVNRNAIRVREQIMHEAAQHGISRHDMAHAISHNRQSNWQ